MRDQLTTLMKAYRQIRRRHQTQPARTVPSTTIRPAPMSVTTAQRSELRAERVDDPFGRNTIVALRGPICDDVLEELTNDSPSWGERTYLDVRNARIPNRQAVELLGMWFERLEARGVHIHVTGISPEHPALRS